MKMRILFLAILMMGSTATALAVERPKAVPSDFKIVHTWGHSHVERGVEEYSLDASGMLKIEKRALGRSKQKSTVIPREKVLDVYWVLVKNEYKKMKDISSGPDTGQFSNWSITANGETKTVNSLTNNIQMEIEKILKPIEPNWDEESEGRFQRRFER